MTDQPSVPLLSLPRLETVINARGEALRAVIGSDGELQVFLDSSQPSGIAIQGLVFSVLPGGQAAELPEVAIRVGYGSVICDESTSLACVWLNDVTLSNVLISSTAPLVTLSYGRRFERQLLRYSAAEVCFLLDIGEAGGTEFESERYCYRI